MTLFFSFIFSTVQSSSLESLNPKDRASIHCTYVKLEELIYDFSNNTVHHLFVLGTRNLVLHSNSRYFKKNKSGLFVKTLISLTHGSPPIKLKYHKYYCHKVAALTNSPTIKRQHEKIHFAS